MNIEHEKWMSSMFHSLLETRGKLKILTSLIVHLSAYILILFHMLKIPIYTWGGVCNELLPLLIIQSLHHESPELRGIYNTNDQKFECGKSGWYGLHMRVSRSKSYWVKRCRGIHWKTDQFTRPTILQYLCVRQNWSFTPNSCNVTKKMIFFYAVYLHKSFWHFHICLCGLKVLILNMHSKI